MNDINSKTLKKKKCACKALLTEYKYVIEYYPLIAWLPHSLNIICPALQEHYSVNIKVHETRSDEDYIIAQFPQEYDHNIPSIDIHQQVNENEFGHVSLTLSETGSGTYVVKQGGANLPRMTFGFENYQNCPQM